MNAPVMVRRRLNVLARLCPGALVVWAAGAARCSVCRRRVHRASAVADWAHQQRPAQ